MPENKLRPGDIVRFTAESRQAPWWPEWMAINGDGPFLVGGNREDSNTLLTHPDGTPFVWGKTFGDTSAGTDRVGTRWLVRDDFLTAVHKAKANAER